MDVVLVLYWKSEIFGYKVAYSTDKKVKIKK